MADDESFLEFLEESTDRVCHKIVKLQALIRGWRVRRQLAEIQHLYQDMVKDTDGDSVEVTWSNAFCVAIPVIKKKRKNKHHEKFKHGSAENSSHQDMRTMQACGDALIKQGADNTHVPDLQNAAAEEKISEDRKLQQRFESVVTQTDFDSESQNTDERTESNFRACHDSSQPSEPDPVVCNELEEETADSYKGEQNIDEEANLFPPHEDNEHDILLLPVVKDNSEDPFKEVPESRVDFQDSHSEQKLTIGEAKEDPAWKLKNSSQEYVVKEGEKSPVSDMSSHRKSQTEDAVESLQAKLSKLPDDKAELEELRNTTAMELLWVQQAINSRKHYLRLRQQLS